MENFSAFRHDLGDALPIRLWDEAQNQASRSTLGRHKTGAVIFGNRYDIIAKGCSHHRAFVDLPSMHAEAHAIYEANGQAEGANLCIVTLTRAGNYARSSRPCVRCLLHAKKVGISELIWAEQVNDGSWIVNQLTPQEMIEATSKSHTRHGSFAKDMRVELA